MSMETSQWLNQKTLIGFTDERGNAWHYRAADQGDEPNHYKGAVPIEDVRRRLFSWEALEGDLTTTALSEAGVLTLTDPTRKTIIRPPGALGPDDEGAVMGVFKQGFTPHQYDEWLLKQVAHLLDDDLGIGSAGLLKEGAVAFVSVEVPESITTPEGVTFRPHLLAATAFDGSLSTTYHRVVTNTVCDNTMSAALLESGDGSDGYKRVKVKHSRYSKVKLGEVREALQIVHSIGDDFAAQVAALTADKVSEGEWERFKTAFAPITDESTDRSKTMALKKRGTLDHLWVEDARVAPWRNTAWGVVQAVNTATHHEFTVRGADRTERNMERAVTGNVDKLDSDTLAMLAGVR